MTRTAALAALAALAGCGGCDDVPPGAVTDCTQGALVPGRVQTDILFVVDDSGSMSREQTELGTAFQGFIDALAAAPVGNDFRIGVTSTSVDWPVCRTYAGAECTAYDLRTTYPAGAPYDGAPYPAGALVAAAGRPRILDAGSPTLVDDFVQNVRVGTGGAAKEQALRAMRLAFTDRIADGSNAGFLRPGARLAVIIVGDEDDCSEEGPPQVIYAPGQDACHSAAEQALLTPVQDYVDLLRGPVAGEVRPALVAAVVGQERSPPGPGIECNSGGYPGYRFFTFAGAFGAAGQVADVCAPDFAAVFAAIASLLDPGQTLPLGGTPPDWRLLQVSVVRADQTTAGCAVGLAGDPGAEAVYVPPQGGQPATLTFQGACLLAPGDVVQIRLLCAG
ncbi:MAG TPA: hypothetical protein VH880_13200 [Anaeromyxobacteraceae bacterium]